MKLLQGVKGILDAIYQLLFNEEEITKIAEKRKAKCDTCLMNSSFLKKKYPNIKFKRFDEHCTLCKCNLFFKQYSKKTKCPNNLWEEK